MREIILSTLLLIIGTNLCLAQIHVIKIATYPLAANEEKIRQIILKMPYAGAPVEEVSGDTTELYRAGELSIDIVCTDYPSHLDLNELNKARLQTLFTSFPFLKKEAVKNVTIYRQMDGSVKETAQTMFHGIVLRYRPRQDKETMKRDLTKLEELLTPLATSDTTLLERRVEPMDKKISIKKSIRDVKETLSMTAPFRGTSIYKTEKVFYILESNNVVRKSKYDSAVIPDSVVVMTAKKAYKQRLLDKKSYKSDYSSSEKITVVFIKSIDTTSPELTLTYRPMPDSIILKVFKRNTWKNTAVVADVTGSMYPYSAQLLLWLKLNATDGLTNRFSFFNDGDEKRDEDKIIGDTKGIYSGTCNTFDEVKNLIVTTMKKGGGGDAPENNVEALLRTEEAFPDIAYTVMIADNWANLKDNSLIDRLKKPVRVVLCGVDNYGVNVDYLNLARKTGGSLHLMEDDLYTLATMHEGEEIKIGFRTFKVLGGEFIEVKQE